MNQSLSVFDIRDVSGVSQEAPCQTGPRQTLHVTQESTVKRLAYDTWVTSQGRACKDQIRYVALDRRVHRHRGGMSRDIVDKQDKGGLRKKIWMAYRGSSEDGWEAILTIRQNGRLYRHAALKENEINMYPSSTVFTPQS